MINGNSRISVLSHYLDGDYFGTILNTIHQEAGKRNSALVAIPTLSSDKNPITFNYRVGTSITDGWVLLLNSLPLELLQAIEATGKPIISIGYREDAIKCHSILIDNRSGTKAAVLHLVREHGHKRIAFVGCLNQFDMIERFEGYKEALHECGIPYDEGLVFHAIDQMRLGGVSSAKEILKRGINFTAIVASTDMNAMALIEELQKAGYRIPEDIAVVGFDDLEPSESFNPPLTTVRQSCTELARAGMDILLQQISGEIDKDSDSVHRLNTELILRNSCGCPYVSQTTSTTESLVEMRTSLDNITMQHFKLAASWVAATREDEIDFSSMHWKNSHWGCLALWDNKEQERKHLIVKQVFSKNGDRLPPLDLKIPIEEFPPREWIPTLGKNEFVRIQSIRNDKDDWGFIVLVGAMDELNLIAYSDITQLSFTILAAALERRDLFNQIRSIAEQLEIVSRTTNDGVWDWDIIKNEITWRFPSHVMLNSITETLTKDPQSFTSLVHPDDRESMAHQFKKHMEEKLPLQMEFRMRAQNGEQVWVYSAGDCIRDQQGNAVRMIGSITDITEKKLTEKKMQHLAFHDGLTGLPNRELFHERLKLCMANAERYKHKLGILLIDLDRFKIINDTLGHQSGDILLQMVAKMLENTLRSTDTITRGDHQSDTVARLGGDEFIVLLTHIQGISDIELVANRIIQKFKEPFLIQTHEIYTSASIGVSIYPDDGINAEELIRCADIAMYEAKDNGKNQMEMYSSDIYSHTLKRFTMEGQLRKALERNEFLLHYQPQINLANGQIIGIEALVRWNSHERGMVSPLDFIPLAEETGLIIPIGRWILKEACRQNKLWMEQGLPPIVVSVNISASQLQQADFMEMIQSVLEETQLAPHLLCLEITESTAIKNMELSTQMLRELGRLGIQIAIDDFGTGYSSLAMLKQLPITNVKIDKSFIRDMGIDQDDAAIVKAIIAMAHSLELTVTAEGVETEDQKSILMNEKCNSIQGYFFSKPLTPEDCVGYIRNFVRV